MLSKDNLIQTDTILVNFNFLNEQFHNLFLNHFEKLILGFPKGIKYNVMV
jgi:hypothetical protein